MRRWVLVALVVLVMVSEAIEKNNHLLLTALGRKDHRMRAEAQVKRRKR